MLMARCPKGWESAGWPGRCASSLSASQFALHRGQQVFELKRLDEIIIHTQLLAIPDVTVQRAGRQEYEGNMKPARVFAHTLVQLVAVQARHGNIGHDQVYRLHLQRRERFEAIAGCEHLIARFFQGLSNVIPQSRLVVNDEDRGGRIHDNAFPIVVVNG